MWSKHDCAQILALAAIVLAIGLLLFPPVSRPATRPPCGARCLAQRLDADVVNCKLRGRLVCLVGWIGRRRDRCARAIETDSGVVTLRWFESCLLPVPPAGRWLRQ